MSDLRPAYTEASSGFQSRSPFCPVTSSPSSPSSSSSSSSNPSQTRSPSRAARLNGLRRGRDGKLPESAKRRAKPTVSTEYSTARGVSNTRDQSQGERSSSRESRSRGFIAAMAADPIFQTFPEATRGDDRTIASEEVAAGDCDRFLQRQYPMLYMKMNAREHREIEDVRYENRCVSCALCKTLNGNMLDSIRVLKPHEVMPYLDSCGNSFTEKQVNVHLAHSAGDENVVGVLQNMSVDLIARSYSLASDSSRRVMNRVRTHMGRTFLIPDQEMAKVHNDAVKQFISLAATCQSLIKHRQSEAEKSSSAGTPSSTHPLL